MLRTIRLTVPESEPIYYVTGGIPSRYALLYRSVIPVPLLGLIESIVEAIVSKEFTHRAYDPIREDQIIIGELMNRILITYRTSGIF